MLFRSLGVSVDSAATDTKEAPKETPTGVMRVISMFFGLISKKRNRTVIAANPANCLYGIRKPMKVYRLINELMDKNVGQVGTEEIPSVRE